MEICVPINLFVATVFLVNTFLISLHSVAIFCMYLHVDQSMQNIIDWKVFQTPRRREDWKTDLNKAAKATQLAKTAQ